MPSISFALKQENIDYIKNSFGDRHRNKSHWLDDLIDHLRTKSNKEVAPKEKAKRFSPPNKGELSGYFFERGGSQQDCEEFFDFYQSKNWMVGKNKMKDWKAAVRNWLRKTNKVNQGGHIGVKEYSKVTEANINNLEDW